MTSECDMLSNRFNEMERQGLVDVKFLLRNTDEATMETVCHEVNDMLGAWDRGDCAPLDFKDSRRI